MEKISQQHIKWANTRAVFDAIADAGTISRADIAARTGLSLMTVGKVADKLDRCGIVSQVKDERILAGRTARLLAYRPEWHIFVLDLTTRDYRLSVLDLACRVVEEIVYPYADALFCEENLVMFLKNLPIYQRNATDPAYGIGAGVLLPGAYDALADRLIGTALPDFVPARPRRTLGDLLPVAEVDLYTDVQAAALATGCGETTDRSNLLRLSLDRPISGALVLDGRPLLGAKGCGGRFGEIIVGTNFTLGEAMLTLTDPAERGSAVAVALHSLIAAMDPAEIRLESREDIFSEPFMTALHTRLARLSPDRISPFPPITTAHCPIASPILGAATAIRERWLHARLEEE